MEDISNINFERNENRPILDNHKVNDNDILNGSPETKLSAAESVAFLQSSPLTEKQTLTSVNNNLENDKPNISFTVSEYPTAVKSNISDENIVFLSSEAGTKAENLSSSDLAYEECQTINNISCKSLGNSSRCEEEIDKDSETKHAIRNSNEIPVGNVNFPPDALSDKVGSDNQQNLSINAAQCNEILVNKREHVDSASMHIEEIKDAKNISSVVLPDLVDFSFREQDVTDNLLESFTGIDSLSTKPEPYPSSTLEEISNLGVNVLENKPPNSSAELLGTHFANKDPKSPLNSLKECGVTDITEDSNVLRHLISTQSPLAVSENPVKEDASNVTNDNGYVVIAKSDKAPEKISTINSSSTTNEFSEVNYNEAAAHVPLNTSNKLDEISPLKVENVSFGTSDKSFLDFGSESKVPFDSSSTNNEYSKVNNDEAASQVSENTSSNKPIQVSPSKVETVSFEMSDKSLEAFTDSVFESKVPIDSSSTSIEYNKVNNEAASQVPENTSIYKPIEISPSKVETVSFGMSDKSLEAFTDSVFESKVPIDSGSTNNEYSKVNNEAASQVAENISSNKSDEVSPLKVEKVSFGMSDKSLEEFPNSISESKVPKISSNNPPEQFSDPTLEVPEIPSNKPFEQSSDPDFAFKIPEVPSNNPLEQFSGPDFAFKMPENSLAGEGDEQFVDAVQFFKDPNSFQFLENIRTSTVQSSSTVPRSSLYVNFDPLHSKFQTNVPRQDNCALITAAVQENNAAVEDSEKCSPAFVDKKLVDIAARESLGNILISFDSPKSSPSVDSKVPVQTPTPPKMFTQQEVQQKLKIHELETQEAFLKRQREMEMEIAKRDQLLRFQQVVIEEFYGISLKLSEDIKKDQEKLISLDTENEKLKEDLKTSGEDLQSVENTFTDFYKRYEQCKGMLKTYKDNEEHLKQTISDLQAKAKEQEQMYHMLQERTEEMLEKANVEVDNVKRSGEAQVTVLKAQLKKAEMKISSLESDIKQIKIENSQLGGICDDLMAKVSRS